jgi:hypothetical protein
VLSGEAIRDSISANPITKVFRLPSELETAVKTFVTVHGPAKSDALQTV